MKIKKRIAIGIPTINRSDLLNEALNVYKDTWVDRDIYIIDNGNQGDIKIAAPNQHLMVTENNLGVSGSWNLLCNTLFAMGYTHVALLNDDVIWKKSVAEVENYLNNKESDFYVGLGTWCLFILPLTTWKKIGEFDTQFYPAYFEDFDYLYRMCKYDLNLDYSIFFNPDVFRNSQTISKDPTLNSIESNKLLYIKKSVNNVFNSGVKPYVNLFEKKKIRVTFDDDLYDPFKNQPDFYYGNKKYNSKIPLKIFQTWGTKDLPANMLECVNDLKNTNPEFEHYLFDDTDCQNFIGEHFDPDVLYAYNKLIPGAFKADLWRYCVLYINGGVYLDIKCKPNKGFKLIELTEKEHFVLDIPESGSGIYNAMMVSKPNNIKLLIAINKVVSNVKNNFYGDSCLEPTACILLKPIFANDDNVDLSLSIKWGMTSIVKNKKVIFYNYKEYRTDQSEYYTEKNTNYYPVLWNNRAIYR